DIPHLSAQALSHPGGARVGRCTSAWSCCLRCNTPRRKRGEQMTPHQPRLPQGVPMMPISPGDVAVIAEMLKGYLTFVRFAYRPSAQRDMYVQYVERLRQRLARQHRENTPLPLTLEDIKTIE